MPKLTQRLVNALEVREKPYEVVDIGSGSCPGFRVRVQPSGVKVYYLRQRVDGKPHQRRIGGVDELPLTRARDLAESIRAQVVEYHHGRAENPLAPKEQPKESYTVGSWIDGPYASKVLAHRKSGKATHDRLKAVYKGNIWRMALDDPKLIHAVLEWREERQEAGRMASTINRDLTALRAALSYAVEKSVLEVHPLQRLRPLKEPRENRVRYLADHEERRMFSALETRAEHLRMRRDSANKWRRDRGHAEMDDLRKVRYVDFLEPAILLMLHTGLRRGECFALRWEDLDFEHSILTVRASGTKSGTARRVPMNDTVKDALEAWRATNATASPPDLVFPSPRGGGQIRDFKKGWASLMREAKIDGFRVHDLRHTFASRLVQRGIPLYTVQRLLGHASITMTQRYAHLAPENELAAVQTLNAPTGAVVDFPRTRNTKE